MAWMKPGDLVADLADADAVFAYQGSIADGHAASYNPSNLDEANDRLWITVARLTDLAMTHDARLRAEESKAPVSGLTAAQVEAIVDQNIAGTVLKPPA